jgi:hypothetical protein
MIAGARLTRCCLLSGAVQRVLSRRDPQAAAIARHRAAEACRRSGELCTAIELFLEAGSEDEAADVCADLAATGETALTAVDDLLHRFPDATPTGTRWLPWRIRAAVAAGHVEEGRQLLEHVDRSAPSTDADDGLGADLTIARAVVAERTGNVPTLLTAADRLLTAGERRGLETAARRRAHGGASVRWHGGVTSRGHGSKVVRWSCAASTRRPQQRSTSRWSTVGWPG